MSDSGRQYLIASWNNASSYSGEMIGQRLKQSRQAHFNDDGTANLGAYADKPKEKKQDPLHWRINPKQKALDLIDQQEAELEQAVMQGEISLDDYRSLIYALLDKRETAYRAYLKSIGELDEYDKEMQNTYGNKERTKEQEEPFKLKARHVFLTFVLICIVMGVVGK